MVPVKLLEARGDPPLLRALEVACVIVGEATGLLGVDLDHLWCASSLCAPCAYYYGRARSPLVRPRLITVVRCHT